MKGPAVLVPFKSKKGKSRLSSVLGQSERRRLAEAMLLDVLGAIKSAGLLRKCCVVSSDAEALSLAKKSGASPIPEPSDRGVNAAVERGMKVLEDDERFIVLPSDLPLLRAGELRHALRLGSNYGCVISPSKSFNGTNLLLFSRKAGITLSYDSNSFWNYLGEAARRRMTLAVYCGKGVLFDVDSVEDLRELGLAHIDTPAVRIAKKALSRWAS